MPLCLTTFADLPQTPGYLPYWMLAAAAAGIYMGVANILHPLHNRIIYTAKPHEGMKVAVLASSIERY